MDRAQAMEHRQPVDAPVARPLILCADDFGFSRAVSQGIAALARQGRLSATSVMVLSPRWPAEAALLEDLRGHLDIGLHLDWTSVFARAAGHGQSLPQAMLRAIAGGFRRDGVQQVIERQLDAFETVWKAPPDHVDGHQHVQQFAGIREALVAVLLRRYRAAEQPWLRISRAGADRGLKSRVMTAMGAAELQRQAAAAALRFAPVLGGIYDFRGGQAAYAARMQAWLEALPAASVLMCHPALYDDAPARGAADEIATARGWEYAHLASDVFAHQLRAGGVRLARGGACLA